MTGSHSFSHVVGTICVSHGDWEPYVMIDRRVTGHGKHGQYSLNIHERRTFHGGLHDGTHVVGKSGAKLKNVGYFAS